MSYSRTPMPPQRRPDGIHFPPAIETSGPTIVTASLLFCRVGPRVRTLIANVEPRGATSNSVYVDMEAADVRHVIEVLSRLLFEIAADGA